MAIARRAKGGTASPTNTGTAVSHTTQSAIKGGDWIQIAVTWNNGGTGVTFTPTGSFASGWTVLGTITRSANTTTWYGKLAQGTLGGTSTDASLALTGTLSSGKAWGVIEKSWSGTDQSTPVNATAFLGDTVSQTNHTMPTVTITASGTVMVESITERGTSTAMSPPGGGIYADTQGITNAATVTSGITMAVADSVGNTVTAGAGKGGEVWTGTAASNALAMGLVVLQPPQPVAAFSVTSQAGLTVHVDGSASTAPSPATVASYDWDWGDGTTHGTGATPTHTYATAGPFTIVLTVTDSSSNTASVSHGVTVVAPVPTGSYTSVGTATSCTPSVGSGTSGCLTALTDGDRSTYVAMVNAAHLAGVAVALIAPTSGQPAIAVFGAQAASAFDGTTPNLAASAVLTVKMYEGATLRGTVTVNAELPAIGPATPPDPLVDPASVIAAVFPWTGMAQNVTDWSAVTFDIVAALA